MSDKVRVTFESVRPLKDPRVGEIPTIRVGVIESDGKSYVAAYLYQHVGKTTGGGGIQPGQWFAIPVDTKSHIGGKILSMQPAGGILEYIKNIVKQIIKDSYDVEHAS